MINEIKDNTLIVCPSVYKKSILKYLSDNKLLINVSFLSIEEYKKNYFFDYDYKAILYLCNTYKLSVNNAKEIINNLYYVEDKDYDNKKLNDLVKYKKELNDYLIYNPLFKEYIKSKHIVVMGYGKLDSFSKSLFKEDTTFIEYPFNDKKYQINTFNNIDKEVEYLYDSIFDLLESGVDINNIHVLNISDEYLSYIKRYNSYFNFNLFYKSEDSIYGSDIAKEFLARLDDRKQLYEYLINSNNKYANKLINIINKYVDVNLNHVKELIIEDLKKINLNDNLSNVISCDDMFSPYTENDYVFIVGFNDSIPAMKKDTAYITNNIRALVGLDSIEKDNALCKENTINYLSSIKNITFTYCKASPFKNHEKQVLFNDVEYINVDNDNNHSHLLNKYKYSLMLDDLNKYGSLNDDINDMYTTYLDNDYGKYDNSYKKFNLNKKDITLSYTSMDKYYKCGFAYYLDYVLKLDKNDNTFHTFLGNVAHYVLQNIIKNSSLDYDTLWQEACDKYDVSFKSNKEAFFFSKIKDEIKQDVEIIREQESVGYFEDTECEKEVFVSVKENIHFKGKIDKILKKDDCACIIDYKTGNTKIEESLFELGLSLQLPSYLFLLKNCKEYKKYKIVGYYLQHLICQDNDYDGKTSLREKKQESMKLTGYSSADLGRLVLLSEIEPGEKSSVVKSLSITAKGELNKRSKQFFDDDMITKTVDLVKEKILEAGDNILNNNFDINPKIKKNKNLSCAYCKFADVCFKKQKDIVYIRSLNDEEMSDELY